MEFTIIIVGVVWFLGHGPVAGALIIGMFWAAMGSPERVRNRSEFRLAVLCLGAAVLSSVVVPLVVLALRLPRPDRGIGDGGALWIISLLAIPSILTTLAILLGIDSVMPGRPASVLAKSAVEAPTRHPVS
ncbi:hypothetical protein GobsT_68840 [Gemmata obscuriglobus]|uniref:Uncharacterized protein n=1 Tax=Gemmata obscuriglobus TaxID=114 RepID=A0A2Z3H7G3_9BACT|nr:hypothetical protein [Gemmata obscuriglobus]AWM41983.1 hypothetical protein C1280_36650 [Gemmata obscuriglobus]QEG32035.1 hypothetical protein GobsT_68840 [Gemmata obscuriglobus]VTS11385.1 unnamed protein product [Gemmata obscuriglobus UQM 2246]